MSSVTKRLSVCPNYNCRNFVGNQISSPINLKYRPLSAFSCVKCNEKWLVCFQHEKKFCRRRYHDAYKHIQSTSHESFPLVISEERLLFSNNEDTTNDDVSSIEDIEMSSHNNLLLSTNLSEIIYPQFDASFDHFISDSSKRFFKSERETPLLGCKNMIATSFSLIERNNSIECSVFEIFYHMTALKFLSSLSLRQRHNFSTLNLLNSFAVDLTSTDSEFNCSRLPSNEEDIQKYYFNRKLSLKNNIPRPASFILSGHACVSIKDILHHLIGFGLPLDGMNINTSSNHSSQLIGPFENISSCPKAIEIRKNIRHRIHRSHSPLILHCNIWSDDFETNKVVKNEKITWIKTISISPPTKYKVSPNYTFIIAISSKEADHEPIHKYFSDELKELQNINYIYSPIVNKNIPVILEVIAICADRPERSGMNKMLGHNGLTTPRWRHACYNTEPYKLPSCKSCIKDRVAYLNQSLKSNNITSFTNPSCTKCANWNFMHKIMRCNPPIDYPKKKHSKSPVKPKHRGINKSSKLNTNIKLQSIVLDYSTFKTASIYSIHNFYYKKWNQSKVKSYFQSIGLNKDFVTKNIINHTLQYQTNPSLNIDDCKNNIKMPALWNGTHKLDQCIDAPMHLLFLGIVKSIMEITRDWLSKLTNSPYKQFGDYINSFITNLSNMNIGWLRMTSFHGQRNYTTSGWLSVHYATIGRLCCILYSPIRHIVGDDAVGLNEFESLMIILNLLLSQLLSQRNTDYSLIDDLVKMFLSTFQLFEIKINSIVSQDTKLSNNNDSSSGNKKKPIWLSKGNFLSLLNLSNQIKDFGSLRNYWDGHQERCIQTIKPYLINARKSAKYYQKKLDRMYNDQYTDLILDYIQKQIPNNEQLPLKNIKVYDRFLSFKVYNQSTNFEDLLQNKLPLSSIYMVINGPDNGINLVFKKSPNDKSILAFEIVFSDNDDDYNHLGHFYSRIIEFKHYNTYLHKSDLEDIRSSSCVVFPEIYNMNEVHQRYTIIDENWKTRQRNNVYTFISFPHRLFKTII